MGKRWTGRRVGGGVVNMVMERWAGWGRGGLVEWLVVEIWN